MSTYNSFARVGSNHEEWKIVDSFNSAYWSGLDSQIYANNILLDEAIQVSYMVSEQIRPYYGYSSYTPNRIHHGARIIQGEITMNFKRDGQLFALLNLLRTNTVAGFSDNSTQYSAAPEDRVPVVFDNSPFGSEVWSQITSEGISPEVAKSMEVKYKTSRSTGKSTPVIQESGGLFETKKGGFDLSIIFGANLSAAQVLRSDGTADNILEAQYQDGVVLQGEHQVISSTGIRIIGVSIAGLAKTITDDGRPLVETYSFQAKDVVILKGVNRTAPSSTGVLKSPVKDSGDATNDYSNGQIGGSDLRREFDI